MNMFDLAVMIGLVVAIFSGFATGLVRSAITILAYLLAMPIAVWVMSYVPPLDEQYASPLGHNTGFFLGAFLIIGMALGKLARMAVDEAVGDDPGIVDRLGGGALGAVRVGLVATSVVLVFDQLIPAGRAARFPEGIAVAADLLRTSAKRASARCRRKLAATIDRLKRERHI